MARRYWAEIDGERLYRDTLGEIKRIAKATADKLGRSVSVGYDDLPGQVKRVRGNPVELFIPAYADAQEKARRRHLDYLAATKARRLARSFRKPNSAALKRELGAVKTGKFAVEAKNGKERLTLFRPSRNAAEALGADFEAAGYKVTIRPV
jgi:hypothetical protein